MKIFDRVLNACGRILLSCAAIALGFGIALAAGTSATVSWTMPTQYTDGSTLPASDIASATIAWAPVAGQSGPSGSLTVTPAAGSTLVPSSAVVPVPCGNTSFTVAITTTATAKYANASSAQSQPPVAYATGVSCVPKAVTGVTVN